MSQKKFSDSHEWVLAEGKNATIGITSYAQKELGEIVFVQFPEIGSHVQAGQEVVVLESTKAAADIYTPISGSIIEVNEIIREKIHLLNDSPEEEGWLFKIALDDPSELNSLYDHEQYLEMISD